MNRRTLIVWGRWVGLYVIVTVFFAKVLPDPRVRISHGVLAYLLLVIGASREAKRLLALFMILAGFVSVNWLFLSPVRARGLAAEFDFFILVGFLMTGAVVLQLVSSLQRTITLAQQRAVEIEQLAEHQLQLEREASRMRISREAEQMKDALIASIAHDLRSPITTVKMLADPSYGINPHVALRRISDEADRINGYLTTFRHYSGVGKSSKLMDLQVQVVDDLIGTAIASYEGALTGREVRVSPAVADELLLVRCDLTLSLQVIGNLLQNAARYSPAPAPIEVWTQREGDNVRIVVADRGPGIAPAEVDLIFQPRRQGAQVRPNEGQGMGLAIARTFARAQLGNVSYRAREGGGSEFSFVLPRSAEETIPPIGD